MDTLQIILLILGFIVLVLALYFGNKLRKNSLRGGGELMLYLKTLDSRIFPIELNLNATGKDLYDRVRELIGKAVILSFQGTSIPDNDTPLADQGFSNEVTIHEEPAVTINIMTGWKRSETQRRVETHIVKAVSDKTIEDLLGFSIANEQRFKYLPDDIKEHYVYYTHPWSSSYRPLVTSIDPDSEYPTIERQSLNQIDKLTLAGITPLPGAVVDIKLVD
mgnify:CR=1 FL=1